MALWYMMLLHQRLQPRQWIAPSTTNKTKTKHARHDPDAPRAKRIVPSLPVYGKDPFQQYQDNGRRITRPSTRQTLPLSHRPRHRLVALAQQGLALEAPYPVCFPLCCQVFYD